MCVCIQVLTSLLFTRDIPNGLLLSKNSDGVFLFSSLHFGSEVFLVQKNLFLAPHFDIRFCFPIFRLFFAKLFCLSMFRASLKKTQTYAYECIFFRYCFAVIWMDVLFFVPRMLLECDIKSWRKKIMKK